MAFTIVSNNSDDSVPIRIERDGKVLYVSFCALKDGDKVCHILPNKSKVNFTVDGDAHVSGDACCDSHIVYDEEGTGYFADMFPTVTRVVTAIDQDGISSTTILTMVFSVPNNDFDIAAAVQEASVEYCRTPAGLDVYEHNCGNFNYGDFADNVPEEICVKHGFKLLSTEVTSETVDFNVALVTNDDLFDLPAGNGAVESEGDVE